MEGLKGDVIRLRRKLIQIPKGAWGVETSTLREYFEGWSTVGPTCWDSGYRGYNRKGGGQVLRFQGGYGRPSGGATGLPFLRKGHDACTDMTVIWRCGRLKYLLQNRKVLPKRAAYIPAGGGRPGRSLPLVKARCWRTQGGRYIRASPLQAGGRAG